MKMRLAAPAALFVIGTAVLFVFGYNFWSYCCGRCTAATFFTLGPFGRFLLGLNLLAAGVLVVFKFRRRYHRAHYRCRCGTVIAADWDFCPSCGLPDPAKSG